VVASASENGDGSARHLFHQETEREFLGCTVGEKGTLLFSNNGGKNCHRQDTKAKGNLNAMHILPLNREKGFKIFAVGDQRTILEYVWENKKNQLLYVAADFQDDSNEKQDLYSVNSTYWGEVERAYAVGDKGAIFNKYGL
jgi:hypothetical protein